MAWFPNRRLLKASIDSVERFVAWLDATIEIKNLTAAACIHQS
ncbi:hypothetical protein [Burkholderia pseudomallei]|nr:hypothetical protein [Burkholderia pseudomallei]